MGLLKGDYMGQYEKIHILKDYMKMLSEGVDPISGLCFSSDTILNNVRLKNCFLDVADILDEALKLKGFPKKVDRRYKSNFSISEKEKSKIIISKQPIAISTFVYSINNVIDATFTKKLRATCITTWLLHNGYLKEIKHEDGKIFRPATEKGHSIGILSIPKTNSYGRNYELNLYDENAQTFILENLNIISQFAVT